MQNETFLPVESTGVDEPQDGTQPQNDINDINDISFLVDLCKGEGGKPWNLNATDLDLLDMDKTVDNLKNAFSWQGVSFASYTGLQVVSGQSGHGKTQLFALLMATILKGSCQGLQYHPRADGRTSVLYVDTEMELPNTQRVAQRVCHLACRPYTKHPDFHVVRLRDKFDLAERWKQIAKAIIQFRPTAIFLDGMLDMVEDMNSSTQAQYYIRGCMSMAVELNAIFFIVSHQNPGQPDKIAGHVGSFLERKCTDILNVVKEKAPGGQAIFHVTHGKTRGKDLPPLDFCVESDPQEIGVPRIYEPGTAPSTPLRDIPNIPSDPQELAGKVFAIGQEVDKETALHQIRTYFGTTQKEAQRLLEKVVTFGAVTLTKKGYRNYYKLNQSDPLGQVDPQTTLTVDINGENPPF